MEKKGRISLIFACLIFLSMDIKSQYIIAGMQGIKYKDIVPDTLVGNPSPSSHKYYYIDIDLDGTNDIKFDVYLSVSMTTTFQNIAVSALNPATDFSYGYMDSTCTSSNSSPTTCIISGDSVLKIYNNGDTITNGIFSPLEYLTYSYWYAPPVQNHLSISTASSEWINQGDKYLGVRYKTSIDTSYGWVKVNVSGYLQCLVEEFSFGKSSVGMFKTYNNALIKLFPNPTSNILSINTEDNLNYQNSTISIQNTLGEVVKKVPFSINISVSDLSEGCYFILVTLQNGATYKTKFIKQ